VYLAQPRDIYGLQNATKEEITATPDNMVREAMRILPDRLEQCREDGRNMREVLFKK
jgi:hypothetical protein